MSRMQQEFEDYMSSQGEWPRAIEKHPDGRYIAMVTESAWEVWQAAWECAEKGAA